MNLLKGTDSTLPNYTTMLFDVGKGVSMIHFFQALGVVYGLGSKAASIHAPLDNNFAFSPGPDCAKKSIDCSGMSKLLIFKCSGGENGGIEIPDGSYVQNDWFAANKFKHIPIRSEFSLDYLQNLDKRYVYIAFCKTGTRGETIGHVWLLAFYNGAWWSLESHGGGGPSMRPRDYPTLARICTDVYPIARNTLVPA